MFDNPLTPFIEQQKSLILDGGLATELEARGFDLDDSLWSARLLAEVPEAIKAVHRDYLAAGADCIIAASYQATILGFCGKGYSEEEAKSLIRGAIRIAREARDDYWSSPQNRKNRRRPLVAASVGPYGAFLADGSEYRGDYGLDEDDLYTFHQARWRLLVGCGPDLMACETIPSAVETQALARLLIETPEMPAWVSFSCRDDRRINDGTPLAEVVPMLNDIPTVVAIGINCTPPRFISRLVGEVRRITDKPIVVYPNSGEVYDVKERRWKGLSIPDDFAEQSRAWREAGAQLIGGCCRTGPRHISQIRRVQLQLV